MRFFTLSTLTFVAVASGVSAAGYGGFPKSGSAVAAPEYGSFGEEKAIDAYGEKNVKKAVIADGWAAEKKLERGYGGDYKKDDQIATGYDKAYGKEEAYGKNGKEDYAEDGYRKANQKGYGEDIGYGKEKKIDEGYGQDQKFEAGYGKGVKDEGYGAEGVSYAKDKKIEESYGKDITGEGAYGKAPKADFGGYGKATEEGYSKEVAYGSEKKIEEGYGAAEGAYGKAPKGDIGGYGKDKEIGYEQGADVAVDGGKFGGFERPEPRPFGQTKLTVKSCNKMIDNLLGHLQKGYERDLVPRLKFQQMAPASIGRWGRVDFANGQLQSLKGKICRKGDFKVLPQGDAVFVSGVVSVPEPRVRYQARAFLYSKLGVRNRPLHLCARNADFRFRMMVDKKRGKIELADLEPVSLEGFHVEDEHRDPKHLAWPFSRLTGDRLGEQKAAFVGQLGGALCEQFRSIVRKDAVKSNILSLV